MLRIEFRAWGFEFFRFRVSGVHSAEAQTMKLRNPKTSHIQPDMSESGILAFPTQDLSYGLRLGVQDVGFKLRVRGLKSWRKHMSSL